jgi:prepilin-type N-terminal cleavage/methylation domain-containing protein
MSIKANLSAKSAVLQKKNSKKGFTLVELVIVIAVLAIIAAIAIPTVVNVINNANKSTDITNAQSIENAIKTAESEVAANATNSSDRVTKLTNATTKNVSALLTIYGVDPAALSSPKVKDASFVYDSASGKVTAVDKDGKSLSNGVKPTGTALTDTESYKIDADVLSIG